MKKQHMIDIVFVMLVFLVFALSIVTVLYAGSRIYNKIATEQTISYQENIALHYFVEKVHQGKSQGVINITTIEEVPVLALHQSYQEEQYVTYIYLDQQNIKEIFTKEKDEISLKDGHAIMEAKELKIESVNDTCIYISITFLNDVQKDLYLTII